MRVRVPSRAGACLAMLAALALTARHTRGISLRKGPLFVYRNQTGPLGALSAARAAERDQESSPEKPVDPLLRPSGAKNLFKHQVASYTHTQPAPTDLSDSASWSDIVYDEVLKNRAMEARREDFTPPSDANDNELGLERLKQPHNFRLTPEGRLRLEDRIENLRRAAHSNPVQYKHERPILWIVRSSHGHYCRLLEKDEDRIKSLVARVRKHYGPSELKILVMKVDLKMPLCEIFVEGSMPDLVRILYARGGTLQVGPPHAQYYVVPRFRTRCELIEKDPRLVALYGRASAPGLFPRWDEDGMLDEIADCMNVRPDFALVGAAQPQEFRVPNAWQVIPMLDEEETSIMQMYYERVHWPTRQRVQRAFEHGVEDFRLVIEDQYERLQKCFRAQEGVLDSWL